MFWNLDVGHEKTEHGDNIERSYYAQYYLNIRSTEWIFSYDTKSYHCPGSVETFNRGYDEVRKVIYSA